MGLGQSGKAGPAARMTHAELMTEVDQGWQRFRATVRNVGRAKMDEQTGAGWSYHDLFAHIAGWQDLTARRLRAYRTTGMFPGPGDAATIGIPDFKDADEFNARLVSAHRLVGAEALVDEVDTTFRSLRAELAKLTDEQVRADDARVVTVVAGNTYGHYLEHAKELDLE